MLSAQKSSTPHFQTLYTQSLEPQRASTALHVTEQREALAEPSNPYPYQVDLAFDLPVNNSS